MNTRDQLFAQALDMISQGSTIDIVGDPGSGRTTFLRRLGDHLLNRSWRILVVKGVPALNKYPLTSLAIAGIPVARDSRVSSLPSVLTALDELLPVGNSALLVDDCDAVDEVSWGALCAFQAERGIPLVVTRGRGSRHEGWRETFALSNAMEVELSALRYDELEGVLVEKLGGPLDFATLSRLYAKSGGNPGIAVALSTSARRVGRLERVDTRWRARGDLWSDAMRPLAERMLEPLSAEQRDLLEKLSMFSVCDLETASRLGSPSVLEAIERMGLLELYPSGERQLIGIRPPLVTEYFRHTESPLRRSRLTAEIGAVAGPDGIASFSDSPAFDYEDHAAQLVRLVHEEQQIRIRAAQSAWRSTGTLSAGIEYLRTLLDSSTQLDELESVFDQTAALGGDSRSRLDWHLLYADHIADNRGDILGAIAWLRERAAAFGPHAPVLVARAAELATAMGRLPDLGTLPDPDAISDRRSSLALHRAFAFAHTARGEIGASERHIRAIRDFAGDTDDALTFTIEATNLLARGATEEAGRRALERFSTARSDLDTVRMRSTAAVAILADIADGRYFSAEALMDTVFALGEPARRPGGALLTLTVMASVLASRRGQRKLAELRIQDTERLAMPDGALLGQSRAWARGQHLAALGEVAEASAIIMESGDTLWEGGARLAAAFSYLSAIEIAPSADLLSACRGRIEQVEGRLVGMQLAYMTALVAGDPDALADAAAAFEADGRTGLAVSAYLRAATQFDEANDAAAALRLRDRADHIRAATSTAGFDPERYGARYVELTDREQEIARLAALGLTNQQIADDLVLSVRTVESHLLRVMRKTGAERRSQLKERLIRANVHV